MAKKLRNSSVIHSVSNKRREDWNRQIACVLENEEYISIKEKHFVSSCLNDMEKRRDLSFKQSSWLRDIYSRIVERVG